LPPDVLCLPKRLLFFSELAFDPFCSFLKETFFFFLNFAQNIFGGPDLTSDWKWFEWFKPPLCFKLFSQYFKLSKLNYNVFGEKKKERSSTKDA
jgi:hypothetical protein